VGSPATRRSPCPPSSAVRPSLARCVMRPLRSFSPMGPSISTSTFVSITASTSSGRCSCSMLRPRCRLLLSWWPSRRGLSLPRRLVFSVVTLDAFVLSRSTGLFGFSESDFDAKALLVTVDETGAVVVVAAWFAATRPKPGAAAVIGERVADETIPGAV
jgi:hypothetical protein